jgi:hypothetical protein
MSLAGTSTFSQLRKHENDSFIGHARRSLLRRTDDGFPLQGGIQNPRAKSKHGRISCILLELKVAISEPIFPLETV